MNAMPVPSQNRSGSLADLLRTMIAQEGPISVERYMALALGHPTLGYYMTRDPLGAAGDFTTAPEISQMFGELLGLWAVAVWQAMGQPDPVRLVELGPGRGTLMADALRAGRALPGFRAALDLHLVETSPVLRHAQERKLASAGIPATWHDSIETLPPGPVIVLANEFFDALPIRQLVRTDRGWCERLVGLDPTGRLRFGLAAEAVPRLAPSAVAGSSAGDVFEFCPSSQHVVHGIAARLVAQGGALLAIDYGPTRTSFAETLQAVKAHRFVDVLDDPGEADLTAHVDFAALQRVARAAGAAVHGPVTQGGFLRALGLEERATILKRRATPEQAAAVDLAVERLGGPAPGMGDLFKVLAICRPDLPAPPGFA